jgi:uncharacterized BrkB/YihY/UPF0761 family membrane protein
MSTSEPSAIQEVVQRIQQFLRLRRSEIGTLLKETGTAWIDDNAPRLGASLAFYTLLSLAPILIVVVAIAALAFGQKAAQGQLIWEIRDLVGTEGARAIQGFDSVRLQARNGHDGDCTWRPHAGFGSVRGNGGPARRA